MTAATEKWNALVARGCLCGTDRIADCPVHVGPSDLRGIGAHFRAGMPQAFPLEAQCLICKSASLLYPDIEIDDPSRSGEFRPSLVCPRCSVVACERALRADAEQFGYALNDRTIFAGVAA